MLLTILKSKIHRAKVIQADLNYVGSITIDEELLRQSGINEYEQVDVVDINNGNRLTTYAISGKPGSGIICLNGAAARLVSEGDLV
ncbi:aspartate 1-decarboxylase, partial [Phocaeicola vulgatus]